jgi:hypothetical protein
LSEIDDNLELVKEKVLDRIVSLDGKGRLIIKKFSQEDTTMRDIRNWIISYQKKHGFKFELLVLDYLDCVESHKKTADRTEAELVIVKSFEALVADLDIPAWSAIQTNRSGFNSDFVDASQSGGSIKRIQKSHFFMSVAKSDTQKEAGLANIKILKARFAADGQTFEDCIFNNDTMEIKIVDDRFTASIYSKGKKHHDSADIDRIENDMNKLHSKISSDQSVFDDLRESYNESGKKGMKLCEIPLEDLVPVAKYAEVIEEAVIIPKYAEVIEEAVIVPKYAEVLTVNVSTVPDIPESIEVESTISPIDFTLIDPDKDEIDDDPLSKLLENERTNQDVMKKNV